MKIVLSMVRDFLLPRKKAIAAFLAAEAATFLVLLQTAGDITTRGVLIAALTPVAAGAIVHQTSNISQ